MADSPVFERTCEELAERTPLETIEVRGTVRIALKGSGLAVDSVDAQQMSVVLEKVLPAELEARGVAEAASVCDATARAIEGVGGGGSSDRAGAAASTLGRFGAS